jgi:HD-GYP domain-containing protein (c-di-GMP phosphodiesterase class II)
LPDVYGLNQSLGWIYRFLLLQFLLQRWETRFGVPRPNIKVIYNSVDLSHIGTIALSTELFQKEGQYTENEFELMKLHAEVSALIVAFATGNEKAASYTVSS